MNIFYLHKDPKTCAQYHNDKHVVKMLLETAQLLCSVSWMNGVEAPYRLSHKNHPSSIWSRQSIHNYNWLCELGVELCREYTYRYNKIHKSQAVIQWCIDNKPTLPDLPFTDPPQAMPDECKLPDTVSAYRNYYIMEKKDFCKWKNRPTPSWFSQF